MASCFHLYRQITPTESAWDLSLKDRERDLEEITCPSPTNMLVVLLRMLISIKCLLEMPLILRWLTKAQSGYHSHNHRSQENSAYQDDQVRGKEGKDKLMRMIKLVGCDTQFDAQK